MGAATKEDRAIGIGDWPLRPAGNPDPPALTGSYLMLPVCTIRSGTNPERAPSLDIARFLDTNHIQKPESRSNQRSESTKSPFGSGGKAGVNESNWNFTSMRFRDQVRPDFRFHQHDRPRPDGGECPAHDRPEIEGRVDHFHFRGRILSRQKQNRWWWWWLERDGSRFEAFSLRRRASGRQRPLPHLPRGARWRLFFQTASQIDIVNGKPLTKISAGTRRAGTSSADIPAKNREARGARADCRKDGYRANCGLGIGDCGLGVRKRTSVAP